jgi:cell pole-organizing protein PopZ
MSPINPNFSDREFDAVHRAQRAHEPSMEEILASIRNIIADDPAKGAALKAPLPTTIPSPQVVYSKDAAAPNAGPSGLPQHPDANAPRVVWSRPQAIEAELSADAEGSSTDPLLSPEASEAVALSFGALSASLEGRSAELADSMVSDMLRPMVKTWLDDNLPAMVERLVREEIQRVARGRK